jgi:replicative DNA helicase
MNGPDAFDASTVPYDLEAEKAVLGAILIDDQRFFDVADTIGARDFFRAGHRVLFQAMHALASAGERIDFRTLTSFLTNHGQMDEVGGPGYIAGLTDGVPRSSNAEAYARLVAATSLRARVMAAAEKIRVRSADGTAEVAELLEFAQSEILGLADRVKGDFASPEALVAEIVPVIDGLAQGQRAPNGIPTGWIDLDSMLGGLRPGNFVLIAGRPSMGKTALALNLAWRVASQNLTVGFFSVEMSREELLMRLVSSLSGIDSHRLRAGAFGDRDYDKMSSAFCQIGDSGLYVDETADLGLFELRSKARRLKARHGLDLLIVDYLQLMKTSKAENRNNEIAALSRGLKIAAKELRVPIVALSQLSREVEKRTGEHKRPQLSDLRDSGGLEQDADVVLFVHRPEVYETDPSKLEEVRGQAQIIVGKQRNGPTGVAQLVWLAQVQRFENLADF